MQASLAASVWADSSVSSSTLIVLLSVYNEHFEAPEHPFNHQFKTT